MCDWKNSTKHHLAIINFFGWQLYTSNQLIQIAITQWRENFLIFFSKNSYFFFLRAKRYGPGVSIKTDVMSLSCVMYPFASNFF